VSTSRFGRYALTSCAAAALLAGCGGSSSPPAVATLGAQARSWMKPGTSSGDLIYALGGCGGTCVLSYPARKLVGTLDVPASSITGDCSDSSGDVFISNGTSIVEYAHGGTTPIATLSLPGDEAIGCSVDPTTGNLAVVFRGSGANIAVFPGARGTPTVYYSKITSFYCGYDNAGDLFVNGYSGEYFGFAELAKGSTGFLQLSISQSVGNPGQVQWDGKYITWETAFESRTTVSRLAISGSSATIVGTSHFDVLKNATQSWIDGKHIFIPYVNHGHVLYPDRIGVWKYPLGGKPAKNIENFGNYGKTVSFQGVTLSVGTQR
jgi:hypothetical protein